MDKSQIIKAWKFMRENNNDIPDDVIDFMKDAALEKLVAKQSAQSFRAKCACPRVGGKVYHVVGCWIGFTESQRD